ncbi:MAG TPA: hypothetical protein VHQ65_00260 [Thermoanaerobaculia bacterium]|nr:hypothetical protein [Thermoanaerobaculia bacterium]
MLSTRFDSEQALPYLWAVEEYNERTGLQPPVSVATVFDDLPPRPPGCCLHRFAPPDEPASQDPLLLP